MTEQDIFDSERPRLFALAYRMLGERAEAEDAVQEAWLRWAKAKDADLRNPRAWLTTVTTRIAIDALKSARARRETYVGPWLPEPLIAEDEGTPTPEDTIARVQSVELALLYVLERLGPEERAAYLLRETFDTDYADIAEMLGKSEAAVRQMLTRARKRLADGPRTEASFTEIRSLLERFLAATVAQNESEMLALLAPDAMFVSDGGGKASAALRILDNMEDIATVWRAIAQRQAYGADVTWVLANGCPALLSREEGQPATLTTLVPDDQGRVAFVYVMRNPDKLAA